MIRVGVIAAMGYAGRELLRLISAHPGIRLTAAVELEGGRPVAEAMPAFGKVIDVDLETFDADALGKKCDVVFLALHGGKGIPIVAALRKTGVRVIDMGPDFRIKDSALFTKYYGVEHTAADLLNEAVYGLVPYYREAIRSAQLVAVPGCYPISVILPLRPLLPALDRYVVADSVSGVSGAGRSLHEVFHFAEMNENLRAYKIGAHQHIPEIEQELENRLTVQFTPHVGPYTRGILSTITARPVKSIDVAAAFERYADEPFVRVFTQGKLPELRFVRASNFCDIGWVMDDRTGHLVLVSAIDNLLGGTAGMALQCFNVMFGFDERAGLNFGGMAP